MVAKIKYSKVLNGVWYFQRRVPTYYAALDARDRVCLSTGISVADDPRGKFAAEAISRINTELETRWSLGAHKAGLEPEKLYASARLFMRQIGIRYIPIADLPKASSEDIMKRAIAIDTGVVNPNDMAQMKALLGAYDQPKLKLSQLFDFFEREKAVDLVNFSPDQRRKWGNPFIKALNNFQGIVGDIDVDSITREEALLYRDLWRERIEAGQARRDTANKDMSKLVVMLGEYDTLNQTDIIQHFTKLRFRGDVQSQRVPFSIDFVQNVLLAQDTFHDLNEQARAMFFVMADTGLRLSEACNILPEQIHLKAPIPYIEIKAVGRVLKTAQSARLIPLVGTALWIMQRFPNGFPRYRDRSAQLSALINKCMRNKGTLEKAGQTLYSLRHTFEDRMSAAGFTDKMMAELMGHKYDRQKYGSGYTLKTKLEHLSKIAFLPPALF